MASSEAGDGDSVDELHASKAPSQAESADMATLSTLQRRPRPSISTADDEQVEDAMDEDSQVSAEGEDEADELAIEIAVPAPINRDEYVKIPEEPEDHTVDSVLQEVEGDAVCYKISYVDGREDIVSAKSAYYNITSVVLACLAYLSI
jgi:hypothetical protein